MALIVAGNRKWHATHAENTQLVRVAGGRTQADMPFGHGLELEIQALQNIAEGMTDLNTPDPTWAYTNHLKASQAAVAEQAERQQQDQPARVPAGR